MGYQCSSCQLDTTRINEMEIYALFQEGSFRIDVKSITAVADPKSFLSPSITFRSVEDIEALIEATIASGGKVYDYGYREICIAIYWSTLNTILEATGIADALKGVACAGLKMVDPYGDKVENAWNLRYTLDAVLADVKGVERNENSPSWLPTNDGLAVLMEDCTGYTSLPSIYVGTGMFDNIFDGNTDDASANENADETSANGNSDEASANGNADQASANGNTDQASMYDAPSSALCPQYLFGSKLVLSVFFGLVYILW